MAKKKKAAGEKPVNKSKSSGGGRSQWSGSISFGLVNIPVSLQTAVREKGIRFHLFRGKDNCKVRRKYVCESDQKEVTSNEIVKGYEIEKGRHVMLTPEEMDKLAPKATREINLLQFADLGEIDPIYFSRPYYLIPQKNGQKAYYLLFEALKRSNKAGIAKMVLRNHQYIAAIRIYKETLCLEMLHFHDEVIEPQAVSKPSDAPSAREIAAAESLIDSLTEKFHPEKLQDDYRETILKALANKKSVQTAEAEEPKRKKGEIVDLMEALEASLKKTPKKKAA